MRRKSVLADPGQRHPRSSARGGRRPRRCGRWAWQIAPWMRRAARARNRARAAGERQRALAHAPVRNYWRRTPPANDYIAGMRHPGMRHPRPKARRSDSSRPLPKGNSHWVPPGSVRRIVPTPNCRLRPAKGRFGWVYRIGPKPIRMQLHAALAEVKRRWPARQTVNSRRVEQRRWAGC
jgi:hypothetical protein